MRVNRNLLPSGDQESCWMKSPRKSEILRGSWAKANLGRSKITTVRRRGEPEAQSEGDPAPCADVLSGFGVALALRFGLPQRNSRPPSKQLMDHLAARGQAERDELLAGDADGVIHGRGQVGGS